jgi:hypothetical protein
MSRSWRKKRRQDDDTTDGNSVVYASQRNQNTRSFRLSGTHCLQFCPVSSDVACVGMCDEVNSSISKLINKCNSCQHRHNFVKSSSSSRHQKPSENNTSAFHHLSQVYNISLHPGSHPPTCVTQWTPSTHGCASA